MSENKKAKPHSQEYFGEWRDFWWNKDFVELMAKRWKLENVSLALDVGCGVGHWGRVLLPFLPREAKLYGIDREADSVATAANLAAEMGAGNLCHYSVGAAEQLPFADNTFDLVTCQTVLIHVPDVKRVLQEMKRVLKPGGLLVAVEPNNAANRLVESSISFDDDLHERLALLKFAMMCERGKVALGLGHNSIGDLVPGLFAEVGLAGVEVYLCDRTTPMIPPYAEKAQQVFAAQDIAWVEEGMFLFSFDDTLRYYLAGGGTRLEFDELWELARKRALRSKEALEQRVLHTAGGGVVYLVSGRKA